MRVKAIISHLRYSLSCRISIAPPLNPSTRILETIGIKSAEFLSFNETKKNDSATNPCSAAISLSEKSASRTGEIKNFPSNSSE
ncbi:hypothetical protein X945_5849 [Burkholderia pseudomallei ABCPW 107]|nr:hypothetical protein X945_5849 [Burkholderia pseudomallei ABCPW 107]